MAEETLRPDLGYVQASVAEMNILENLRNLFLKLQDEVKELYESCRDVANNMIEAVKVRFERIRKHKLELESIYRDSMFYLFKVGPGLVHKDAYVRIHLIVLALAEDFETAGLRLLSLGEIGSQLDDETLSSFQKFLEYIMSSIESVVTAIQLLLENPKKSLEHLDRVSSNEDICDEIYRNVSISLPKKASPIQLILIKDFVDLLERASDNILRISEELRYVAAHKI